MFASFAPLLKTFFVYIVAFYQQHLAVYMGSLLAFGVDFKHMLQMPEINLPNINLPDINIPDNFRDGAVEIAEDVLNQGGHDDTADALDIAL